MNRRSFLLTLPLLPLVRKLVPTPPAQNCFFCGKVGQNYSVYTKGETFIMESTSRGTSYWWYEQWCKAQQQSVERRRVRWGEIRRAWQ